MKISCTSSFEADFESLDKDLRFSVRFWMGYFCVQPQGRNFATKQFYLPGTRQNVCQVINAGKGIKAAYYLVSSDTTLFVRLFNRYEQPVVLPQEVQT